MSIRIIEVRDEVGDVVSELSEGPMWDARFDVLRWVDITGGRVHSHSPTHGQLPSVEVGRPIGFIVPAGEDRLLAGMPEGFAYLGLDGEVELVRELERGKPDMRMNDGKADPAGRVWGGTCKTTGAEPAGTLYRLDADLSATPVLTGLTIPNGLGWSPDGSRMYYTDTVWQRVDVFDYDLETGEATNQRAFVDVPRAAGQPDGLTVDEEGCVWLTLWCGAAVHRYTPDGELDTIVRVPALQTTSCTFGGSDGRDLFITSANIQLDPRDAADHPRSGRVFTCRPGVAGLPTDGFRPAVPPA